MFLWGPFCCFPVLRESLISYRDLNSLSDTKVFILLMNSKLLPDFPTTCLSIPPADIKRTHRHFLSLDLMFFLFKTAKKKSNLDSSFPEIIWVIIPSILDQSVLKIPCHVFWLQRVAEVAQWWYCSTPYWSGKLHYLEMGLPSHCQMLPDWFTLFAKNPRTSVWPFPSSWTNTSITVSRGDFLTMTHMNGILGYRYRMAARFHRSFWILMKY